MASPTFNTCSLTTLGKASINFFTASGVSLYYGCTKYFGVTDTTFVIMIKNRPLSFFEANDKRKKYTVYRISAIIFVYNLIEQVVSNLQTNFLLTIRVRKGRIPPKDYSSRCGLLLFPLSKLLVILL